MSQAQAMVTLLQFQGTRVQGNIEQDFEKLES